MNRSPWPVRIVSLSAGLFAAPVIAQTPPSTISACYNATNGALRVVASASDCRTAERFLSWSSGGGTGPQGETGPAGPPGPAGPAGPSGAGIDKSRIYQNIEFANVVFGPASVAEAFCNDANDVLLSGGYWGSHIDVHVYSSYSNNRPSGISGWQVAGTSRGAPGLIQAIVNCLRVD